MAVSLPSDILTRAMQSSIKTTTSCRLSLGGLATNAAGWDTLLVGHVWDVCDGLKRSVLMRGFRGLHFRRAAMLQL